MRKLLLIIVLLPTLASGAVFKCVGESGRITFSDKPCSGQTSEKVDVKIDKSSPAGRADRRGAQVNKMEGEFDAIRRSIRSSSDRSHAASAPAGSEHCREFSDTDIRTMVIKNQVVVGMKGADARRAWGTPHSVNGVQYVYWWNNRGSYFYVRGGCVSSVDGEYRGSKFVR